MRGEQFENFVNHDLSEGYCGPEVRAAKGRSHLRPLLGPPLNIEIVRFFDVFAMYHRIDVRHD